MTIELFVPCVIDLKATYSQRLIKLADLNHHQTFFAGRCSEWFLESSYFAVAQYVDTKDTVLLVLHGIDCKITHFFDTNERCLFLFFNNEFFDKGSLSDIEMDEIHALLQVVAIYRAFTVAFSRQNLLS